MKTRPTSVPIPPDQTVAMLQASKELVNAWLESGLADCAYGFPAGDGFCIANHDSHETLMDTIVEYPQYPFMDWEITPLVDANYSFDKFIAYFKSQAG